MNKFRIGIVLILIVFTSCSERIILIHGDIETYHDIGFYNLPLLYSNLPDTTSEDKIVNIKVFPNGSFWGLLNVNKPVILKKFDAGGYTIVPNKINLNIKFDSLMRNINLGYFYLFNTPDLLINSGNSKHFDELSFEVKSNIPDVELCKILIFKPNASINSNISQVMEIELLKVFIFDFNSIKEMINQKDSYDNENFSYRLFAPLTSGYYMARAELYLKDGKRITLVSYTGNNFFELVLDN